MGRKDVGNYVSTMLSGFYGPGAEFVQRCFQVGGYGWGFAGFDVAARHHVNELAVAQNGDRRWRRRLSREIAAGALGGFEVLPSEHGKCFVRSGGVLQSNADGGTHATRGASANGVHNHQGRTRLRVQGTV